MIRIVLALTITACLWIGAQAQFFSPVIYFPTLNTYIGPGDIQSGATAFYSLRGYSKAYVIPGTNLSINVERVADSHTCDILIAQTGGLGNTTNCSSSGDNGLTPIAFSGIDATCTGTISSTTLSCTSASSQPKTTCCDLISGSGIVGLYTLTCGTFTAGSGTCTLNAPPVTNITTPEIITLVNRVTVPTWYDQSGNGANISQSNTSLQYSFNPTGLNGTLPIVITGSGHFNSASSLTNIKTYLTAVAARQVAFTTQQGIISSQDTGNNPNGPVLFFTTTANTVSIYGGNFLSVTGAASDLELHSLQGVLGTSGVLNIDGTETTGNTGSGGVSSAVVCVGGQGGLCNGQNLEGVVAETGAWVATPNSTVRTSMCDNMRIYWGTPGSC